MSEGMFACHEIYVADKIHGDEGGIEVGIVVGDNDTGRVRPLFQPAPKAPHYFRNGNGETSHQYHSKQIPSIMLNGLSRTFHQEI